MAQSKSHVVQLPDRRGQQKAKPKATAKKADPKELAKLRRKERKESYPVTVLQFKMFKGISAEGVDAMFTALNEWASENKYVISQTDPVTRKNGWIQIETTIDTPESFAASAAGRSTNRESKEMATAIAAALRSDSVIKKAIELNVSPKELVLNALSEQFGVKIGA